MEELADAWIVETRLPFLDQGQLETSVVRSFSVYWERRPAIQILVLFPVAESQLSLDQPIVVELEKFSGATIRDPECGALQTEHRIWAACS